MAKKSRKCKGFDAEKLLQLLQIIPEITWVHQIGVKVTKQEYLATIKLLGIRLEGLCHPMLVQGSTRYDSLAAEQARCLETLLCNVVPIVSVELADDMSYVRAAIEHGCKTLAELVRRDI